jgi:hypothetical protein
MPFSSKITEFGPGAGFGFHAPASSRITTEEQTAAETQIKTIEGTAEIPDWLYGKT